MQKKRADKSAGIYALADRCGVSMADACELAAIAASTPPRWRRGFNPRPGQIARLRSCILRLAATRGTLPAELEGELPAPNLPAGVILQELQCARSALDRIELQVRKSISRGGGVK